MNTTISFAAAGSGTQEKAQAEQRAAYRKAFAAIGIEEHRPTTVKQLNSQLVNRWPAIEAGQGAAADASHFYAIVNYVIGKYDRNNGELVARWKGTKGGPIRHINSCYVAPDYNLTGKTGSPRLSSPKLSSPQVLSPKLLCANSNHPQLPMASSIEIFDVDTMTHVASHSLGIMDEGSLVWFDRYQGGWLAGFAHYDDETGLPYKDQSYAGVVLFDNQWRRRGGYQFPAAVIQRMAPQAASGGAIGPDSHLYVMGHDRPEMYVLKFPAMGPVLEHIATVSVPLEGQAFAFDPVDADTVWGISRPNREVRQVRIERP